MPASRPSSRKVSAARPKIADYPFTTLHPQLGVVNADGREFVLADIPGLIEGAHEGAGLGDRFLGHVERCRVLLHLIDATCEHAGKAYKTVRKELDAYGGLLTDKIEIVALNKIDAVEPDELKKQKDRLKRAAKKTPLLISGITGEGVKEALRALVDVIGEAPVSAKAKSAAEAEPWSALIGRALNSSLVFAPSIAQHPAIKKRQGRRMARAKNVLWIMCDQLRYDYLGCTGHPTLKTPNIDAMAKRGVLFSQGLCAVADLRPVADVVLHRPLHALARLALERLAAARRRAHARRSSARKSACATCWSARPTWRPISKA